jgi:hypothetical protein
MGQTLFNRRKKISLQEIIYPPRYGKNFDRSTIDRRTSFG